MSLLDLIDGGREKGGGKTEGIVIGLVTNNKDPDGLGRVKLKFPWKEGDDESYWARLATPMAGNDRGIFFLPEVGDEVLVALAHNDIQSAYVIGALWNGKDAPPETNSDGKNNIRKIKTRSGHEIIFDDNSEEKKERIEIHSKAGHSIVMDDSDGAEKIEIRDKSESASIILDTAQKSITVTADKVELTDGGGSNKMVIDGTAGSISIESAGQLTIKSPQVEITADSTMTVKSGGITKIEGSLVQIN